MKTLFVFFAIYLMADCALGSTDEQTAFLKAITSNDIATVRTMLDRDASLADAKTPNGRSAAMVALFIGTEKGFTGRSNPIVDLVLAKQTSMDLFEVAAFGTAAAMEDRLAKEPVTARNAFGWTALHVAAFAGNVATTEALLRHGAPIDARAKTKFKNTPLQTALLPGEIGTARVLIEHGADVLVRQSGGFAPIHEAALLGRVDLLELLIANGAELNARANDGRTTLSEAIRGDHADAIAFLRTKNANAGPISADLTKEPKD